jgi:hypothetical protein
MTSDDGCPGGAYFWTNTPRKRAGASPVRPAVENGVTK